MRIRATLLVIALLGLPACGDDTATGPTNADFSSARAELAAKAKDRDGKKAKAKPKAKKKAKGKPAEASFASVEKGFHYDPRGKRDPFRSFEWEQLRIADSEEQGGPLEQFDISQLSLVGVIWHASNARALVQDPSGMSYIVAEGARIGKNDGRVMRIDDNLMVVRETYEDWQGEETTKNIEMRIRVTEGG